MTTVVLLFLHLRQNYRYFFTEEWNATHARQTFHISWACVSFDVHTWLVPLCFGTTVTSSQGTEPRTCMSPEPCCWELTTPARWAESLYVLPPALTEEHDVRGSGIPWGQLPGLYSSQHLVSADHSLAGQPEKQKKPEKDRRFRLKRWFSFPAENKARVIAPAVKLPGCSSSAATPPAGLHSSTSQCTVTFTAPAVTAARKLLQSCTLQHCVTTYFV